MSFNKRLFDLTNYCLFYGRGKECEIANYDLAIVEPAGQTGASLEYSQSMGTIVIAYLSAMEIAPHSEFIQMHNKRDLLTEKGNTVINQKYGTYLADLTSVNWCNYVLHQAGKLIIAQGYDGLFLDTLGDVEWEILSAETRQKQMLAAAHLIAQLRQKFPQAVLIQNNGLEKLALYTQKYLDGLCWENPTVALSTNNWNTNLAMKLSQLQQEQQLRILVLEEKRPTSSPQELQIKADEQGFLYYASPGSYTVGITPLEKK